MIAYLPLLTFLLPVKIQAMSGAQGRLDILTVSVLCGALAASVSNIVFGALSDRSRAAGGGRRGWLAGGVVATAASYAGIALAASPMQVVAAVILFQVAVNALLAPLLAIMADEVPDADKGVAGGLLALGAPAASAVSAMLVGAAALGEAGRLGLVPLLSGLCLAPLLLIRGRSNDCAAPAPLREMSASDLRIAWVSRLMMQVAGNALLLYLLYYFESVVPDVPPLDMAARLGHLLTVAYVLPLPVALLLGRLSDRSGQRRLVLLAMAMVAATGLVVMALSDEWDSAAAGFAIYAVGSSVFLALHAAFAMQLLPDAAHRGRDLGVLNLTNTLPALAGPLLAWMLATPHDFAGALLGIAALTLGSGVTILAVRSRA